MYLSTDHSGLNKFSGSHDENFALVQAEICRMFKAAPQTIEARYQSMAPAQGISLSYSGYSYPTGIDKRKDSFHVPFSLRGIPVMDKFVGRNAEITRLAQLMILSSTDDLRRKVCIIHGIGGVGKSQLAVEFARKHHKKFSAVFWIAGKSKEKLRRSIAALAQTLPQHQISERARLYSKGADKDFDAIVEEVLKWFSQPSNNMWLMVFDNVDREYSLESEDPEAFDIRKYLPEADHGSIIITSRLAGLWRLAGSDMRLEPFDELQGEILLNSIVEKPLAGSLELVRLLGGLPLAIEQAASYIRETGTDALEYMKLYEETWGALMTQQQEFALQEGTDSSILTTWTVSFNELQKKSQDAANLLILWAFLDNQDIWYELFTPTLDLDLTEGLPLPDWFSRCIGSQFEFKKCTRYLIRYSFVTANIDSLSFSVHSVLHHWCFHNSDRRKNGLAWLAAIVVGSAVPTKSIVDYTLLQRRLLPHSNLIYRFFQKNILKNMSEELELPLIKACHFLAIMYSNQDKMAEAEAMYLRALAGYEKACGPDDKRTLDVRYNLAAFFASISMLHDAAKHFELVPQGYTKLLGPEHPETFDACNILKLCQGDAKGTGTVEDDENDSDGATHAKGTSTLAITQPS